MKSVSNNSVNNSKNTIAVLTSIYNPTEEQLNIYFKSLESFNGLAHQRYAAIKKTCINLNKLIIRLKKHNIKIKVFDDKGTDDALNKLMPFVKEDFIWMLHCGDLLQLDAEWKNYVNRNSLDKNTIYFGTTFFCSQNKIISSKHYRFNLFYKYRIPILNLISCLLPKKILLDAGGFKQTYKVATDYDLILRLYRNNPYLNFIKGITLYFYENGNSFKNKLEGIIEMYFISKSFYPKLKFRNIFYFIYVIRRGFSPFLFFDLINKTDEKLFTYIINYGFQPYSDKKINAFDIYYLNTLKYHYKKSFRELDQIIASNPACEKFLEFGSHLAVNSIYAKSKGLTPTCSDLYTLGKDSNYRKWLYKNNIKYVQLDLSKNIPLRNKFDIIYFHETLEHIPYNPVRVLTNVNSILNKNGILNITVPNLFSLKNIFKLFCLRHPYILSNELIDVGSQSEKTGIHWIEYEKKMLFKFLSSTGYHILSHEKAILNYGNYSSYLIKRFLAIFFPFIYDQHRVIAQKI